MGTEPPLTLSAWGSSLKSRYPTAASLRLQLDDFGIEVRVNREELQRRLCEYFEPFVAEAAEPMTTVFIHEGAVPPIPVPLQIHPPGPGKTKIKEEFCDLPDGRLVRKHQTGLVLAFNNGEHHAVGPCLANVNQVVNFINHVFIADKLRQGGLLAHAAGVAMHERGLALAGASGTGKSTLALHLLGRGARYVSNDRLVLLREADRIGMYGVAKWPRVNPGTILHARQLHSLLDPEELRRYAGMDPCELWSVEHKHDVFLERSFGAGTTTLHHGLHGLVLLDWRLGGGACRVCETDLSRRPDLLAAVRKSPGVFFRDQKHPACDFSESAYLRLLQSIPCLEISGGVDFETAAMACEEQLLSSS